MITSFDNTIILEFNQHQKFGKSPFMCISCVDLECIIEKNDG